MCCGKRKQWLANPMEQCNGKLARTKKGDKAISAKIRDYAENTSLNEEMLTKRKDKRHSEV